MMCGLTGHAGVAVREEAASIATSPPGYPKVVIRGDYADPTILRDGADYYMTHSPFGYAPAFLIWHSKDLQHWTPIAHAMTGAAHAYAPELAKVGGKYYIYYPSNKTNFVITADNIRGPWSAPVDLKIPKIDPGHAIGEDGKRYLFTSGGRRVRLADDGLSTAGVNEEVYAGWTYPAQWQTECMCLESPKLVKRDGYFYMISAQGGTAGPATSHMAVVARSRSIDGPWENSPLNPLVHTYDASERWWSKGHGTLVDDVNGNWWLVYHAYDKHAYTLGRMTLIDPVTWTADGWPVLATTAPPLPAARPDEAQGMPLSDDFTSGGLGAQWRSWRNLDGIALKEGALYLTASGTSVENSRQLMVLPTAPSYEAQVEIELAPGAVGGLMLVYNDKAFAGVSSDGERLSIHRSAAEQTARGTPYGRHFYLKIINREERCVFLISRDGKQWEVLAAEVDVSAMNHNNYHGFLSLKLALTAAGSGTVKFDNFQYREQ